MIRNLSTDRVVDHLRGRCWVRLRNGVEVHGSWREGRRDGAGGIASPALERLGVVAIAGYYREGVLQGQGRIHMKDGSVREGWFLNGKLHGPVRGQYKVRS